MLAFYSADARTSANHPVEFVDQLVERLQAVFGGHGRVHRWALNLDVPLGKEFLSLVLVL